MSSHDGFSGYCHCYCHCQLPALCSRIAHMCACRRSNRAAWPAPAQRSAPSCSRAWRSVCGLHQLRGQAALLLQGRLTGCSHRRCSHGGACPRGCWLPADTTWAGGACGESLPLGFVQLSSAEYWHKHCCQVHTGSHETAVALSHALRCIPSRYGPVPGHQSGMTRCATFGAQRSRCRRAFPLPATQACRWEQSTYHLCLVCLQ